MGWNEDEMNESRNYVQEYDDQIIEGVEADDEEWVQCSGCGAISGMTMYGKPHACHRNEDGKMEEGGQFMLTS